MKSTDKRIKYTDSGRPYVEQIVNYGKQKGYKRNMEKFWYAKIVEKIVLSKIAILKVMGIFVITNVNLLENFIHIGKAEKQ